MLYAQTFEGRIFVGPHQNNNELVPIDLVKSNCRQYCSVHGLGVTVLNTISITGEGEKNTMVISFFHSDISVVEQHCINLGKALMKDIPSVSVTVAFADQIIVIESNDL